MPDKIIVSGVGCCLVDLLYNDIDFDGGNIRPFLSKKRGDGGLTPGKLVFMEEFEKYCGSPFDHVLKRITGGKIYNKINIGGPSVVSLINAAQMTGKEKCEVRYYGRGGRDEKGQFLFSALKKTPVVLRDKKIASLIITDGSENIMTYSDGSFFGESGLKEMPVSGTIKNELQNVHGGDTTGCGDNFAGGVIASLVTQLHDGVSHPDLQEACCWGIVSGGFACFYMGGTWFEEKPGEKLSRIRPYYESYKRQISG
ncbi:MAG: hypothetical protein MUO72_02925 [Bacteroidales bacterium]|nr:hypothetical protein [Bacteroidales bacterium]